MPARDKTGPNGQGPLTGRRLGPCGAGFARGFGRGFGRRALNQKSNFTKDEEKEILEQELEEIEAQKEEIKKRLKEL